MSMYVLIGRERRGKLVSMTADNLHTLRRQGARLPSYIIKDGEGNVVEKRGELYAHEILDEN